MKLQKRLTLSIMALALMPLAPVMAADYEPPIEAADEYVPVEVGSGWYLRGDVGYALSTSTDLATYRTFDPITSTYGQATFDTSNLSSQIIFGGGVGYRYNEWVRGDATIDGFRSKFTGTTSGPLPCLTTGPINTACRSEDAATVSAISFMGNGYIDLGTYIGITPYVGAGAGMSYVSWSGLASQNYCIGATCPGTPIAPTSNSGVKDWRFTYAFMAGAAYDLTKNLKLDVGYKYRKIDDGEMFGWNAAAVAAGASGTQGSDQGLTQHEVKVGLRYELW
jgi:opacity protein-like surface antigen